MHRFALLPIEQIKGKINFFKLEVDGECEFDNFINDLTESGELSIVHTLFALMESVANLTFLPQKKYRELKGRHKNDIIKDYEIKKSVNGVPKRIYLFKDSVGNIVVFGSSKASQEKDIARLRRIKKEYFKSKDHVNKRRIIKK